MDRRTRNLFALLLALVVVVTGGAALLLSETAMPPPEGPPETSVVQGVVIAVDSAGLGDVRAFTLRTGAGETLEFQLSELENAAEFPPAHLAVHQVDAYPVLVTYRMEDGALFAVRLEDGAG